MQNEQYEQEKIDFSSNEEERSDAAEAISGKC